VSLNAHCTSKNAVCCLSRPAFRSCSVRTDVHRMKYFLCTAWPMHSVVVYLLSISPKCKGLMHSGSSEGTDGVCCCTIVHDLFAGHRSVQFQQHLVSCSQCSAPWVIHCDNWLHHDFDSCDPIDDRFEHSEFDRLHMTIGLQTGMDTVFAYRFANRSSCVNALLWSFGNVCNSSLYALILLADWIYVHCAHVSVFVLFSLVESVAAKVR